MWSTRSQGQLSKPHDNRNTRGRVVRAVAYRGFGGVVTDLYLTGRQASAEPVSAPEEVYRILGRPVMHFDNITEATQYLVTNHYVLERLTIL
jgi:hypothetical protein